MEEFLVVISCHYGIFRVRSLTDFTAASSALRVAGTEVDNGYIGVEDSLGVVTEFEFVRIDDMLAIV